MSLLGSVRLSHLVLPGASAVAAGLLYCAGRKNLAVVAGVVAVISAVALAVIAIVGKIAQWCTERRVAGGLGGDRVRVSVVPHTHTQPPATIQDGALTPASPQSPSSLQSNVSVQSVSSRVLPSPVSQTKTGASSGSGVNSKAQQQKSSSPATQTPLPAAPQATTLTPTPTPSPSLPQSSAPSVAAPLPSTTQAASPLSFSLEESTTQLSRGWYTSTHYIACSDDVTIPVGIMTPDAVKKSGKPKKNDGLCVGDRAVCVFLTCGRRDAKLFVEDVIYVPPVPAGSDESLSEPESRLKLCTINDLNNDVWKLILNQSKKVKALVTDKQRCFFYVETMPNFSGYETADLYKAAILLLRKIAPKNGQILFDDRASVEAMQGVTLSAETQKEAEALFKEAGFPAHS